MSRMTPEIRSELAEALSKNERQLGKTYALMAAGAVTNRELVDGGASAGPGGAANLRCAVRAILDQVLPSGPSVALMAGRSVGGVLRANPDLSQEAQDYLNDLRLRLDAIATDSAALEQEDETLEQGSKELERSLENSPGVYVFTLPTYYRSVQRSDPDRYFFKVGKSDRAAGIRVSEQMRATGLPEDPWIARVYRHPTRAPKDVERDFHTLLEAAGHTKPAARHAGREWYVTNLEFLDAVGVVLGCDVQANDGPDDE
jgi:hypothetical protein